MNKKKLYSLECLIGDIDASIGSIAFIYFIYFCIKMQG